MLRTIAFVLFAATSTAPAEAQIRITEFMYAGEEFIELTNVGSTPVDFTGWSFGR